MKKLLFATSIVALSTAARAAITCNLTDEQGNALQYSFAHGQHGYTNETSVKRNGTVLSSGGPTWTRFYNPKQRTVTLQQTGWSLIYEAKPHDTDVSGAALYSPANIRKATGTCMVDYTTDAPATTEAPTTPVPEETPAPAPVPTPQEVEGDSIPLVSDGRQAVVKVYLGSYWANMLIDTGATSPSINIGLATSLVNDGEAHYSDPVDVGLAGGVPITLSTVIVNDFRIGNHTLHNVRVLINPNESTQLLSFPVLNQMGKFTVDTNNGRLIFGPGA